MATYFWPIILLIIVAEIFPPNIRRAASKAVKDFRFLFAHYG